MHYMHCKHWKLIDAIECSAKLTALTDNQPYRPIHNWRYSLHLRHRVLPIPLLNDDHPPNS
jgi:hypothetical protein